MKLTVSLTLLGAALAAAQTGEVRGKVADVNAAGIAAKVELIPADHRGMLLRAESPADGGFRIRGVAPGWYLLHVTGAGYMDKRIDVEVREGETADAGTIALRKLCGPAENCGPSKPAPVNGVMIRGRVIDQTGAEILDGHVSLTAQGSREEIYGTEIQKGRFGVSVEPNQYSLRVAVKGFASVVLDDIVAVGGEVDLGAVTMRVSCGFPCDTLGMPPERVIAASDAFLHPGCGINLERKSPRCEQGSAKSDLKLETSSDGAVYLVPANGARIAACDALQSSLERIRIDRSHWGEGWCVRTREGHESQVFLRMDEVPLSASEVAIWFVTRR